MIVKNESEFLEGALSSIRKVATELIVVDTGSDDDTVAIATYAGRVARILGPTEAGNARRIHQAIDSLSSGGSTAMSSGIDLAYQMEVAALLHRLNRDRGVSMVLATHDLNLAASLCDSLVLVRSGRVLAHGPTREVLNVAMIEQLYDVETDVQFHEASGHLTVVPIRRAP